jgi:hypothetical protein
MPRARPAQFRRRAVRHSRDRLTSANDGVTMKSIHQ